MDAALIYKMLQQVLNPWYKQPQLEICNTLWRQMIQYKQMSSSSSFNNPTLIPSAVLSNSNLSHVQTTLRPFRPWVCWMPWWGWAALWRLYPHWVRPIWLWGHHFFLKVWLLPGWTDPIKGFELQRLRQCNPVQRRQVGMLRRLNEPCPWTEQRRMLYRNWLW